MSRFIQIPDHDFIPAQVDAPTVDADAEDVAGSAVLTAAALIPRHLLNGGEVILLALKPSLWFIPLSSLRWLAAGAVLVVAARTQSWGGYGDIIMKLGLALGGLRLVLGLAEWVSRCYVLTNRRVMRIRGFVQVEVFECPLTRIQNTELILSPGERLTRTGTIVMATAADRSGLTAWHTVARPLEVHERLRSAISRAGH